MSRFFLVLSKQPNVGQGKASQVRITLKHQTYTVLVLSTLFSMLLCHTGDVME